MLSEYEREYYEKIVKQLIERNPDLAKEFGHLLHLQPDNVYGEILDDILLRQRAINKVERYILGSSYTESTSDNNSVVSFRNTQMAMQSVGDNEYRRMIESEFSKMKTEDSIEQNTPKLILRWR